MRLIEPAPRRVVALGPGTRAPVALLAFARNESAPDLLLPRKGARIRFCFFHRSAVALLLSVQLRRRRLARDEQAPHPPATREFAGLFRVIAARARNRRAG